jgi:hypothetical protein
MGTLSERIRRVLRAIYRGLGATAVTLGIQACNLTLPGALMYGPGPDQPPYYREELRVRGCVKSGKTGEPVRGIRIWFRGVTSDSAYSTSTYSDGGFSFYLREKDDYTIIFTDIDGVYNGGSYQQCTINRTWEQLEALGEDGLIIELEEVDEE